MFDDKMLVKNTLLGDIDSFSFLIEKYKYKVSSLIYRIFPNRNDAEVVSKEIFIKAYKNLSSYDFTVTFSKWLFSLTKYIIISHTQNSGMPLSLEQELSINDFPEALDNNLLPENFAKDIVSVIKPEGPQVYNMTKKIPQSSESEPQNINPQRERVQERIRQRDYDEEPVKRASVQPKKKKKSHMAAYILVILFLLICLGIEIFVIRQLEKGINSSNKQSMNVIETLDTHKA